MRTVRVLFRAASLAAVAAFAAACGDSPTTVDPRAAPGATRTSASASTAPDTSGVMINVSGIGADADVQLTDTSGYRRGVQMGGGGN